MAADGRRLSRIRAPDRQMGQGKLGRCTDPSMGRRHSHHVEAVGGPRWTLVQGGALALGGTGSDVWWRHTVRALTLKHTEVESGDACACVVVTEHWASVDGMNRYSGTSSTWVSSNRSTTRLPTARSGMRWNEPLQRVFCDAGCRGCSTDPHPAGFFSPFVRSACMCTEQVCGRTPTQRTQAQQTTARCTLGRGKKAEDDRGMRS